MSKEELASPDRLFRNVLFVVVTYAVVLFTCMFITVISVGRGALLMVPAMAIIMATFELSAMWAVLGPGAFWRRAIAAFGLALVVAIAGIVGTSLGFVAEFSFDDFLVAVVTSLSMIPFLWLMAQMPFWVFRGLFGWHLATWPGPVKRSPMTIRDMLAITALIGISLAGIRLSFFAAQGNVAESEMFLGTAFMLVPLTIYSLMLFLLFTMPAMLLILRPEKYDEGCQWFAGVAIVIVIFLFGFALAVLGAGNGAPEVAGVMCGFIGLYCLAIGVPMLVLRDSSIVLYSRGREKRWQGQSPAAGDRQSGGVPDSPDPNRPPSEVVPTDPLGIEDEID